MPTTGAGGTKNRFACKRREEISEGKKWGGVYRGKKHRTLASY